jgi:hypothetical protein
MSVLTSNVVGKHQPAPTVIMKLGHARFWPKATAAPHPVRLRGEVSLLNPRSLGPGIEAPGVL